MVCSSTNVELWMFFFYFWALFGLTVKQIGDLLELSYNVIAEVYGTLI